MVKRKSKRVIGSQEEVKGNEKNTKKTSKKENEVKKSNNTETKKTTTKSSGNKKEKDWDRIVRTYGVGGKK